MKKKSRHKKFPLIRVVLAIILTCVLVGSGIYAYFKKNPNNGVTLTSSLGAVKTWVTEHKSKLHAELKSKKKAVLDDETTETPIKFEFYSALENNQVHMPDTVTTENKKTAIKPVSNHDELEKEFYNSIQTKK